MQSHGRAVLRLQQKLTFRITVRQYSSNIPDNSQTIFSTSSGCHGLQLYELLILIAQAVFLSERRHTDIQTYPTHRLPPAWISLIHIYLSFAALEHVIYSRGSVWRVCCVLCIFGFVDDVMFRIMDSGLASTGQHPRCMASCHRRRQAPRLDEYFVAGADDVMPRFVYVAAVNTSATGGTLSDEQTVYILYIALAGADLILVLLSIIMLFGVEPVICIRIVYIHLSGVRNEENSTCT